MPDMIETYAGPTAWWEGISPTMVTRTLLDKNLTSAEMLKAASLDWTVSKRPLFFEKADEEIATIQVPNFVATVRDSDDAYLGMVTPTYQIVQNSVLAELGDALKGAGADWHTAGSLYGGRIVWLQAVIERELFIHGDPSKYAAYLLIRAGHDGNHTVDFVNTPQRVVCANTMTMAIAGAKARIGLRHTTNVANRLDEVAKALGMANDYLDRFEEVANELTTIPMSLTDIGAFTEKLIPTNPQSEHPYKTEKQRQEIIDLFSASPTLDGVAFTAYRAFQAVAEWTDHVATINDTKTAYAADRRADSILDGNAFAVKTAALKLLTPVRI
jgi:phage/plasmid-like protein (TIGR03299 family)